MTENENEKKAKLLYAFCRGIAIAAGLFAVILGTLLFANWLMLAGSKPVDAPPLVKLYGQLKDDPGDNDLKEQIRVLDLMIRKAYFTRQWQVNTGLYLLLGALGILGAALIIMERLRKQLPVPGGEKEAAVIVKERALARWSGGGIILAAAGVAVIIAFTNPIAGTAPARDKLTASTGSQPAAYTLNWPALRGPGGRGVVEKATAPVNWDGSSGEGIRWKIPVPMKGFNSPVIWEKHLFLSGGDEKQLSVYCYDTDTGALRWQKVVKEPQLTPEQREAITDDTGFAAPTMATDGQYAFAIFTTGDIAAFDFDGNMIWARNLGMPDINYGYSSSLISYNNLLIVQYDHSEQSRLLILDPAAGTTLNDIIRDTGSSWASPVIAPVDKKSILVMSSNPYVTAYDPDTRELLWSTDCMSGEIAPSPAFNSTKVFAVNQFATLAALDIKTGILAWEFTDELPNVASPVANDAILVLATSYGFITCLDPADGSLLWTQELTEGFYASPLIIGDRLYLLDMTGTMYIYEASRENKHITHCALGENTVCTPAFKDGRFYIRGDLNLYCIEGTDD